MAKSKKQNTFFENSLTDTESNKKYNDKDKVFTPYTRIPPIGRQSTTSLHYSSDSDVYKAKKKNKAAKKLSGDKAKAISAMQREDKHFLRRKTYVVLDPIIFKKTTETPTNPNLENSVIFGQKLGNVSAKRENKSSGIKTLDNLFRNLRLSHKKEFILLSNKGSSDSWDSSAEKR